MSQTHHHDAMSAAGSGDPERTTEIPAQQTRPVWFGQPETPTGQHTPTGHPTPSGYPAPGHSGYPASGHSGYPAPGHSGYPTHGGAPTAYGTTPQAPAGPPPPAPPRGGAEPAQPAKPRRWAELTAVATLAAVLASGGTYAVTQLVQDPQSSSAAGSSTSLGRGTDAGPVQQADATNPNWTATSAAVSPSVVAITVSGAGGSGQGSGVVIDDRGHVLTNHHVISGAGGQTEITVTLNDGRAFKATVAGTDPSTDLAVLTLQNPPEDLQPVALGDSDALKVGDPVMAVGNPLGLAGTVTTGIVSALNRPVTTGGESQSGQSQAEPVVTNAIQTSAAINPGNSGGALVNASGQLVGINSSIATLGSSQGSQGGSIGIGFAIPDNEAKSIATQLIDKGSAQHAFLGVTSEDGTAADGKASRAGATIREVSPGTPAAEAGLRSGDTVIAVDGDLVDSSLSLVAHIRERSVGDKVKLTVLRDGERVELTASLAARPSGSQ